MSGPDRITMRVRRAIGEIGDGPQLTAAAVARKAFPTRVAAGGPLAEYQRVARDELVRMFGSAR